MNWEHVAIFCGGIVLAALSGLYYCLQERRDIDLPRRVIWTAVLGAVVAAAGAQAYMIEMWGWTRPWAMLAVSVPAGAGAPVLIAAAVRFLAEKLGGKRDDIE